MKQIFLFFLSFLPVLSATKTLPVVLWHGMGDTAEGLSQIKEQIESSLNIYVYSIQIGQTPEKDRNYSFLDLIKRQVLEVCSILAADPNLRGGFNAVGFSQGGLFLRTYVQLCNSPPVFNLVSIGSPHSGVSEIPKAIPQFLRPILAYGVYSSFVQNRVVQAQYFKAPQRIEEYLENNVFLPMINAETEEKNQTFAIHMKNLNRFVMVMFESDEMVSPKETAWFDFVDSNGDLVKMASQEWYKGLGLDVLDAKKRLYFESWPGNHLQFTLEFFHEEIIVKHLGGKTASPLNFQ